MRPRHPLISHAPVPDHRRRRRHAPAPPPPPLTEEEIFARKSLDQLNAERPLDDVFFDLDQSSIRDDARRGSRRTRTG